MISFQRHFPNKLDLHFQVVVVVVVVPLPVPVIAAVIVGLT